MGGYILIGIILSVIIGMISSARGYNSMLWFFYGLLLWPIALVHILLKPNLNAKPIEVVLAAPSTPPAPPAPAPAAPHVDKVARLLELEGLRDRGVLSETEFAAMKAEVMGG